MGTKSHRSTSHHEEHIREVDAFFDREAEYGIPDDKVDADTMVCQRAVHDIQHSNRYADGFLDDVFVFD